ncbi:MAG: hypothetical protein M3220_01690 [Chloroflexota bacterium]|nr:hypothetical protein [Chloroflexota bacterium]
MIGEIIETTSLDFLAESLTLHQPPDLGELVKVNLGGQCYCYGVVCYGTTSSPDAGRRAVRRSEAGVVDENVYRAHPQLERLLQTVFRVVLVGWQDGERVRQTLPPSPPPLHHAVHKADAREVQRLTENLTYFRLLVGAKCETPSEQVLAAHIRRVMARRGGDLHWLQRAARESAILLKSDHERLMAVLAAIDPE